MFGSDYFMEKLSNKILNYNYRGQVREYIRKNMYTPSASKVIGHGIVNEGKLFRLIGISVKRTRFTLSKTLPIYS